MTKILIAGAEGKLGRGLLEALTRPGLALDPGLPPPYEVLALSHSQLDITRTGDVAACLEKERPAVVLDAAGFTDIDLGEFNKWEAYLVNRDGASHLARACTKIDATLVYFSTDLIFDGARAVPYHEEDPPNPLSIYADTKLAGELATMQHATKYLIVRSGWIFSRHGRNPVTTFMEGLRHGTVLLGHDDQLSQPTSADDLADAVLGLLARSRTGTYHAASEGEATEFQVAQHIVGILKPRGTTVRPMKTGSGGRSAPRPRYSVLDCRKLAAEGIKMPDWRVAVERFVRSLRGGDTKILR